MSKLKFNCVVEEVGGTVLCFIHGADRWQDFEQIVRQLQMFMKVEPVRTVDGPDVRVFEFVYIGHTFSLICDDAYGHELRMQNPQDNALMTSLAERLQQTFEAHV